MSSLFSALARNSSRMLLYRGTIVNSAVRNYTHHKYPRIATMDELPVPCGCWQDHYNNRQKIFHSILGLGAFSWLFSCAVFFYLGGVPLSYWPPNYVPLGPSDWEE